MNFTCFVSSCRYNSGDGICQVTFGPMITEDVLTAAGFLPMYKDYEEREEGGQNGQ